MTLLDKNTNKPISIMDITSTEPEYWTKWILVNDTGYPVRYEMQVPDNINIITKLPGVLIPDDKVELDVKINTSVNGEMEIKLIPHITEVKIN